MAIVIHFNTFFGKNAEELKLDLLDKLEFDFAISIDAKQVFENPNLESDGFDLYLKYDSTILPNYDYLSTIATEYSLYVLVYDFGNKTKRGYWYDEDEKWVDFELTESIKNELNSIFYKL
jgi:hypothetical protein